MKKRTYHRRAVLALAAVATLQAESVEHHLNFVACPIVRDTKTVPCFLAEYKGELYFLGTQGDLTSSFYPPQLLHQALIEGVVSDGPRVCGGIPLRSLTVSVLPEVNRSCNVMLPAEDGIEAPKVPRGPGPSSERYDPAAPRPQPEPPKPPYQTREFTIRYDFDSDYLSGRSTRVIEEAINYAKLAHASSVEVVSYRAASRLSSGEDLAEQAGIAERRGQQMDKILKTLGLSAESIHSSWKEEPEASDGVSDPQHRRTTIVVKP